MRMVSDPCQDVANASDTVCKTDERAAGEVAVLSSSSSGAITMGSEQSYPSSPDPLDDQLARIAAMDRQSCIAMWKSMHGCGPPKYTSLQFLRKALAYEIQVKLYGNHSRPVRNLFKKALKVSQSDDGANPTVLRLSPLSLKAGTHFVREWNGRTYQVIVQEDGFIMDGKRYRFLSQIARHITGAHWSGPRFFGLVRR